MPDQMGSLAATDSYPLDEQQAAQDAFEAFAARTRQSVQPTGGRTEAPGQIVGPVVNALVTQPVNKARGLMQTMADYSANEFPATQGATEQSTDYDPRRAAADYAAGTAFNVTGAGFGLAPEGALGMAGGRVGRSRDTLAGFEPGQAGNTPSVATNIVKYNEGSPFLKTDKFHGFSGLRTGKPVNEMEYQITGEPKFERPVIDPQSLIGKELIFAAGDRSTAGGVLQSVGGTKLTRPQPMEGGADYAFSQADKPIAGMSEDARRMWANASPQTSGLINLGNEVLARGREQVLMYQAMAKHSVDSSKQMALPAYDLARQSSISNAGASFINKAMEGVEGFPGWRSPKLHDWLSNTATGTERGRVVKAMDSEVARDAGFPDLGELRYAITNPHLRNTPTGSVGLTISPFEPGLGRVEQSLHSTYPTAVAARGEPRTFGGSVPWHVAGPDLHANLMKYGDPVKVAERPDYYSSRMPVGLPRTQLVTPRVADSISEWMYRNPKLWGSAAAAPGFGALAAQDNYQQ
jgi:hypothetical protein